MCTMWWAQLTKNILCGSGFDKAIHSHHIITWRVGHHKIHIIDQWNESTCLIKYNKILPGQSSEFHNILPWPYCTGLTDPCYICDRLICEIECILINDFTCMTENWDLMFQNSLEYNDNIFYRCEINVWTFAIQINQHWLRNSNSNSRKVKNKT